jgi:hypothetical protein
MGRRVVRRRDFIMSFQKCMLCTALNEITAFNTKVPVDVDICRGPRWRSCGAILTGQYVVNKNTSQLTPE